MMWAGWMCNGHRVRALFATWDLVAALVCLNCPAWPTLSISFAC